MIPLSVLDLVSVCDGGTPADALAETAAAAKVAEDVGYKRYWTAEHHGMEGLVGGAVSVVLAHIGHATSKIRIGAGGVMLPNHNPLVIAEQFGTLNAMFPGRIDLGLGRAPGADSRIAHALRKDLMRAADQFPQDVVELQAYFAGDSALPIKAGVAAGADVDMWILGSSLFGAQLAAHLGLPYAFASHFAPALLDGALRMYRDTFRPSAVLAKPHVMLGMTVLAAETDEEANFLSTSMDQSFVAYRTGRSSGLKPPVAGFRDTLAPGDVAMLDQMRAVRAVGGPETIRREITQFIERTGADELMVAGSVYDQAARHRSLAITMEALG
ncbi:MAG: LLM class flavin-dependent oxidoreductase [Sphingomonadaceae bacterium]|nr:LLM class flavin-dependent oxidoreductase [Sphingomonadaceae bacterium]